MADRFDFISESVTAAVLRELGFLGYRSIQDKHRFAVTAAITAAIKERLEQMEYAAYQAGRDQMRRELRQATHQDSVFGTQRGSRLLSALNYEGMSQ